LRRQLYDNGRGFGSYLLTCWRNRTVSRLALVQFVVRDWLGWWLCRRVLRPRGLPRRLVLAELMGALLSPIAYRAAQARAKQVAHETESRKGDAGGTSLSAPPHRSCLSTHRMKTQADCGDTVCSTDDAAGLK
ncbi:MAG: hypothetical protein ACREJU_06425, partial [Nitrospiraceae bacterium]